MFVDVGNIPLIQPAALLSLDRAIFAVDVSGGEIWT